MGTACSFDCVFFYVSVVQGWGNKFVTASRDVYLIVLMSNPGFGKVTTISGLSKFSVKE
jgi:hypothetical protein